MSTNLPLTGKFEITAVFKQKNSNLWKTLGYHTGIDFIGSDDVYATCDGVVDSISYSGAYGNYIIIKEDGADRYHYFCHLKSVKVPKGRKVNRTTRIGIMGKTGNATGKHLHYEIRKQKGNLVDSNLIDPAAYCGIPNEVGEYNSKDYPIQEKPTISYEAYVQNIGWQESKEDGEMAGTVGEALRIESINIHSNVPLQYRCHIQDEGWTEWFPQDCIVGTIDEAKRLEAIHIIAQKELIAQEHIQDLGWQEEKVGTELMIGTEGKALRLEALKLRFR